MVRLADSDPYDVAARLADEGLQVFPARYRDKIPIVKWREYQDTGVDRSMTEKWFKGRVNLNYWVMTGHLSGYVVVDCDSDEGQKWWADLLGQDVLDATARVKTSKGFHYWFKIAKDKPFKSWSVHPGKDDKHNISFDVRADGTGVIVPPSLHETGLRYTWEKDLSEAQDAPPALADGTAYEARPVATGDTGDGIVGTGTRSMLSRLLSQPPGAEGSGRNDWLTKVAGHYAKTYHNQEDLFLAQCTIANKMMGAPLDEAEFDKTIGSVWRGEHERNPERTLDANCGYLMSAGTTMMCQVQVNQGDEKVYELAEYADFDLVAKGVMLDEAGRRVYLAQIVRTSRTDANDTDRIDVVLRAEALGDERVFRKFLASFACTILPPDNMFPRSGSPGLRIQRYLESQQPPVVEITPALGFHPGAVGGGAGGFVTHEGIITSTGLVDLAGASVRVDPRLKAGGIAPHFYGFVDNEVIARDVLREVLTFHDDSVTTVFGAWWAACLLKPQLEERSSLFPFVAVEAPSESGKTNGFFNMMTQLNGNTRGETQPTKAALRDMAAAHRNGIVWVDDLDDPAYLMELLRAATSGGTLAKMGEDRESVTSKQIVSPIVISGETLGMGTQKALIDRAVVIKAPSPTGRRSLHNPNEPQWNDVLAVMEQYPDGLSSIAGWFVQDALSVVEETLAAMKQGRAGGSGRAADKVAILRAGARLLDYLVRHEGAWAGTGEHARRLELWLSNNLTDVDGNAISSQENALTLEVLPWALRTLQFPDKAVAGEHGRLDTPAFIRHFNWESEDMLVGDDIEILFNCDLLSDAWRQEHRGAVEKRTTTADAFKDQAKALGLKVKRVKIASSGGRLMYYYPLKGEIAQAVVRRALGR